MPSKLCVYIVWLVVLYFYEIPECTNKWILTPISIFITFLLFFVLFTFIIFLFYYYPLDDCLFSKEREKGGGNDWEEMLVELRKVGGEETISEYIFKNSICNKRKGQILCLSMFNFNFKRIIYKTIFGVKSVHQMMTIKSQNVLIRGICSPSEIIWPKAYFSVEESKPVNIRAPCSGSFR